MRRRFVCWITLVSGWAGGAALGGEAPPPEKAAPKYDILLITIDALRADHLGCYGYRRNTSPTLDALANEALLFEQCIAQAAWTLPSMASMLTGQYVGHHGVEYSERRLTENHLTAATLLRMGGFSTVAVVDSPYLGRNFGFQTGFDVFGEGDTHGVTTQATAWLKRNVRPQRGRKRFFMWLHYLAPHRPYAPPSPYHRMFNDDSNDPASRQRLPLSSSVHAYKKLPAATVSRQGLDIPGNVSWRDVGYCVGQYDGEIRFVDDELQGLFAAMRELGLWENCIVAVTADHGEVLGEHGVYFDHGLPWDPVTRIPLIFRVPAAKARGRGITSQVRAIDVLPTLLELVGLEDLTSTLPADHFDGESFSACFQGRTIPDRVAFGEQGMVQLSYVRSPPWKYIEMKPVTNWSDGAEFNRDFFRGRDEIRELYNIRDDPGESKNLIEAEPKKAHEMRLELFRHKAGMQKRRITPGKSSLDQKTLDRLRELGYVQ